MADEPDSLGDSESKDNEGSTPSAPAQKQEEKPCAADGAEAKESCPDSDGAKESSASLPNQRNDLDFKPESVVCPGSEPASSPWDDSFAKPNMEKVSAFKNKLKWVSDHPSSVSSLNPCPDCQTLLEPWQLTCHNCFKVMSEATMPSIKDAVEEPANLEDAFQDWLKKGKSAFADEHYGEAQACFQEALARTRVLPNSRVREIEVRRELARALEKSEKNREASEQYVALSQLNRRTDQTDEFTKRAKALSLSTMDILSAVDRHASFRQASLAEIKLVPLYCAYCKRLLLEAEIYALRKGKMTNVRCFCSFEGVPLVRSDAKHLRALKTATDVRYRKAQMIQVASQPFFEGRQKRTAAALAVLLGTFGVHKFYLGEKFPGLMYVAFCWTGLPTVISLFEAVDYWQMSRITFNLTYNIEQVLLKLPPEEESPIGEDHSDVFSMEISAEEADDFVDQYCSKES